MHFVSMATVQSWLGYSSASEEHVIYLPTAIWRLSLFSLIKFDKAE